MMNPPVRLPASPDISFTYTAMMGSEISDDLLNLCAQLFSTNYGKWGKNATTISQFTKPGQRLFILNSLPLLNSFVREPSQDGWQ